MCFKEKTHLSETWIFHTFQQPVNSWTRSVIVSWQIWLRLKASDFFCYYSWLINQIIPERQQNCAGLLPHPHEHIIIQLINTCPLENYQRSALDEFFFVELNQMSKMEAGVSLALNHTRLSFSKIWQLFYIFMVCYFTPLVYSLFIHNGNQQIRNLMLNLTDDRADRRLELDMYRVLARLRSVNNFSFCVNKNKWVIIDFSKHSMNHSPVTIEGTTFSRVKFPILFLVLENYIPRKCI